MKKFSEFVDKKKRDTKKQLELLEKMLSKHGFKVKPFIESTNDPYIYVEDPNQQLSFGGIRIYKIGNSMAFRVQNEDKTHPYGKAYPLEVEKMYDDLISDSETEEKAGKIIVDSIVQEIRSFFSKSMDAEKSLRASDFDQENIGLIGNQGTDYANTVHTLGRQYGIMP